MADGPVTWIEGVTAGRCPGRRPAIGAVAGRRHGGTAARSPAGRSFRHVSAQPVRMSSSPITVYRLQACPYCERVIRKLNDLGLEYDSRFVEARHSRRDVVKRVSGSRTVPALVDERTGVTMSESANIVEYLEATYGDGGPGSAGRTSDETAARADGGD